MSRTGCLLYSKPRLAQFRDASICVSMAILCNACFLIPSKEDIYRRKMRQTIAQAKLLSNGWDSLRLQQSVDWKKFDKDDWESYNEERRASRRELEENGIDWKIDGNSISYEEVLGKIDSGYAGRAVPRDAWGFDFEFRIVDDFLVVRSPGANGIFDKDLYRKERFPWLSGGDVVLLGGRQLSSPRWPKVDDWLHPDPPETKDAYQP